MKRLLILFAAVAFVSSVSAAQFSKAEKTEIQTIVHDYLVKNPQILVQMSNELQQRQYQDLQKKALKAIKANRVSLFAPDQTQVAGNPKGKVTLIELFDYQCVHCANLHKKGVLKSLIAKNPDLRVVYKEFPIFGAPSIYAAKAAMAATQQGQYLQMRNAIFNTGKIEGKLKDSDVDAAAKKIGLNMKKYRKAMAAPKVKASIDETYKLAQALSVQGTPSFVIAPTPKLGNPKGKVTFIPGLVGPAQMQQAIDAAK